MREVKRSWWATGGEVQNYLVTRQNVLTGDIVKDVYLWEESSSREGGRPSHIG